MDIKKKTKKLPLKKKSQEPDLSFLKEEQAGDMQAISQPQHLTYKLGSVFKQRSVLISILAVILFGGGIFLGTRFGNDSESVSNSQPLPEIAVHETQQVAGESDQMFPPDVYHRLELVAGDIYYSLIIDSDSEFYRLTNIFYTIEETSTDGGQPRLVLAMYAPAGGSDGAELLLPREQVKTVAPLDSQSSIVAAIEQYLASQPAASLASPAESVD